MTPAKGSTSTGGWIPSKKPAKSATGGPATGKRTKDWCNFASVLDVHISSMTALPFEPPIEQYIDEALVGMRYSQGGTAKSGSRDSVGRAETSTKHLPALTKLLRKPASVHACSCVFWVAIGILFRRMQQYVLQDFRQAFSEVWHLVKVDSKRETPRESLDWVENTMPFIFGQTVYRILCDAFDDDRSTFISNAGPLINRLMQVIHYEAAGVHVNMDTVDEIRRRLFIKRVIQYPYASQHYLKDMKKQEGTECQKQSFKPLTFGRLEDGTPLDAEQLKFLEEDRAQELQEGKMPVQSLMGTASSWRSACAHPNVANGEALGSDSMWALPRPRVPQPIRDLCVDRSCDLVDGEALLKRQLAELASCMEDMSVEHEEDADSSDTEESCPESSTEPSTPMSAALDNPFWSSDPKACASDDSVASRGSEVWFDMKAGAGRDSDSNVALKHTSPRKRGKALRKRLLAFTETLSAARDASVAVRYEQKRRIQQLDLQNFIVSEPLPKEIVEKELTTTWVSPAMARLTSDKGDRSSMLRRPRGEVVKLRMAEPSQARSLSTPALRTLQKQSSAKCAETRKARVCDAKSVSQSSLKDDTSAWSGWAPGKAKHRLKAHENESVGSSSTLLPASIGHRAHGARRLAGVKSVERAGEVLQIGAPRDVSGAQVVQSLDAATKATYQNSFSEYKKRFDIRTGVKKTRLDGKQIRKEEEATLRKTHELLNDKPMRMIPLSELKKARI